MKYLSNISVVELAMYLPLPYAGAFMAKMGAEVCKIEMPVKGDPLKSIDRGIYEFLNKDKKIIYKNLKDEEHIKDIKELILKSDVVLNGFRRGYLDKIGLGYKDISKVNKDIIYINLYGYPKEMNIKDKAGHDINFLALSGILDELNRFEKFTKPLPIQIADMSGALWAIIGTLLMLIKRKKEKLGGEIDMSLFSSLLSFMPFFYYAEAGGEIEKGLFSGSNPFYNIYRCKDGGLFALGCVEDKFTRRLLEIFNIKVAENLSPEKKKRLYFKELKRIFSSHNRAYFVKLFEKEDICVNPVINKNEFHRLMRKNIVKKRDTMNYMAFPIRGDEI